MVEKDGHAYDDPPRIHTHEIRARREARNSKGIETDLMEHEHTSSEGLINDGYRDKRVQNLNQTCSLYFCCNVGGFLWDVNSLWQVRAIYADRREGI